MTVGAALPFFGSSLSLASFCHALAMAGSNLASFEGVSSLRSDMWVFLKTPKSSQMVAVNAFGRCYMCLHVFFTAVFDRKTLVLGIPPL